jgi:DivIVA domain-containing protein
VSTTFPRADKNKLGYSLEQVEEFLAAARRAYNGADGRQALTAAEIRSTAFTMQKGGYSPEHVDAALERLEDAMAAKERERAAAEMGQKAWIAKARDDAREIVARLQREAGERFARTSILGTGYNRSDVDRFANRVVKYFNEAFPLTVEDVRTSVFRPQRGGYQEAQVDAVLDAVVDVMLAVR